MKTKKSQDTVLEISTKKNSNLTRFHGVFFELEILEILTIAFLLKTIFELEFFSSIAECSP